MHLPLIERQPRFKALCVGGGGGGGYVNDILIKRT